MSENTNHRRSLQQSMGEVVVLPHDDPQREEVEQRIANHGVWAEESWSALLDESEALRAAVPDAMTPTEPPVGFDQRLLAIANDDVVSQTEDRPRRWIWSVAAVAALILICVVVGVVHNANQISRSHTLAVLAINNHVNHIDDHGVSVETSDASELERALSEQLPFNVVVPGLGDQYRLLGGRKCKLGTHPVAYSMWEGARGKLSLFQYRSDDFKQPLSAAPQRIQVRDVAIDQQLDTVMIWTDEGVGYVLVGDPESALDYVNLIQESRPK